MELDLVDPVAEAIMCAQPRWVGVGLEAPLDRLLGSGQLAQLVDEAVCPRAAFPLERLPEWPVGLEEVVVDQRRGLVQDLTDARSTSCASSATRRSCATRSSVSPAIGDTIRVSTPASR